MTVMYRANNAPSLKVHLGKDEDGKPIKVEFKHGILHLTDETLIERMDTSVRESIGHLVQRVDIQAGLAVAQAHQEQMLQRDQIAKGSTTSGHLMHEQVKAPEMAMEAAIRDPSQQTGSKELRELNIDPNKPVEPQPQPAPEPEPTDPTQSNVEPPENKQPNGSPLDDLLG